MTVDFVKSGPWRVAEEQIASRLGLRFWSSDEERILEIVAEELRSSDFSEDDVRSAFEHDEMRLVDFTIRWHADCQVVDYGEEWDPAEGDQQEDHHRSECLGIGRGFLVGHALFFLYAKQKPKALLGYVRRRGIPHAAKVAKDIMRVYRSYRG